MEFCDRIKSLRIKRSMTQKELSTYLNVSEISIRNWEAGVKNPSMTSIISMAKVFNVSTDYLLGVETNPNQDELLSLQEMDLLLSYRKLDEYGKRAIKALCSIEKSRVKSQKKSETHIVSFEPKPGRYIPKYVTPSAAGRSVPLDGDDFEMILVDNNIPYNADFAVNIQGDSMSPYINDGDTVYVKKNCELSIGDIGIFCVDGAMYCKQYFIDNEQNLILLSANPNYKNTNIFVGSYCDSSVKCYGKVLLKEKIKLPCYISDQ